MPNFVLDDINHTGYQANITFSANTGGTYSLGLQTIPYTFSSSLVDEYPWGKYTLVYPQWGQTCEIIIPDLSCDTDIRLLPSTPTQTPTNTRTPTQTTTNTPTNTPTNTQSPTQTPTNTKTPTNTPTNTITSTTTSTPNKSPDSTPTNTPTPSISPSITPTNTQTPTITPTNTQTPTITPTNTPTPTVTQTSNPPIIPTYFVSEWDRGEKVYSGNLYIEIPIIGNSGIIYWGDGTSNPVSDWPNQNSFYPKHRYSTAYGPYIVVITGPVVWQSTSEINYPEQLFSILQWGTLFRLADNKLHFIDCQNLRLNNVSDVLNLDGCNSLGGSFINCINLTTIANVSSWNTSNITSMAYTFDRCTSFNDIGIANWDVTKVVSMTGMFMQATSFDQDISGWDVRNVRFMDFMFTGAINFDQDISGWDVRNVIDMRGMFFGTRFNRTLLWDTSSVLNFGQMFEGCSQFNGFIGLWNTSSAINMLRMFKETETFNQNIKYWDVSNVSNMTEMFNRASLFNQNLINWCVSNINQQPNGFDTQANSWTEERPDWGTCPTLPNEFVSVWRTTTSTERVYLPIYDGGNYNFIVDWGDGNIETITDYTQTFHIYATAGIYVITISGTIEGWNFSIENRGKQKILGVLNWGPLRLGNDGYYFSGCSNLNLSSVRDNFSNLDSNNLKGMFKDCISLTKVNNINTWSRRFENMSEMFMGAVKFDQDISGLSTQDVLFMDYMFYGATSFNNGGVDSISGWTTTNVRDMNHMFYDAIAFNQNVGAWDTSNVLDMSYMFYGRFMTFNRPIGTWNVTNVSNFLEFMGQRRPPLFSESNLDDLYNGWSTQNVIGGREIQFGLLNYTAAGQPGRDTLINTYGWTIDDGGQI